jgi:hypothetical protein
MNQAWHNNSHNYSGSNMTENGQQWYFKREIHGTFWLIGLKGVRGALKVISKLVTSKGSLCTTQRVVQMTYKPSSKLSPTLYVWIKSFPLSPHCLLCTQVHLWRSISSFTISPKMVWLLYAMCRFSLNFWDICFYSE